ncbi:MAG: CorA family divalent cation transporter [Erysipelotrichaceae bacterium]
MIYRCEEQIQVVDKLGKEEAGIVFLTLEALRDYGVENQLSFLQEMENQSTIRSHMSAFEDHYTLFFRHEHHLNVTLFERQVFVCCKEVGFEERYLNLLKKRYQGVFHIGQCLDVLLDLVLTNQHDTLQELESMIFEMENRVLQRQFHRINEQFLQARRRLLYTLNSYEQISDIGEELEANELEFFSAIDIVSLNNVKDRYNHYADSVHMLSEYLSEVIEIYQAQVAIEQNDVMKLFTVLTAFFLPPTLIVGWYGMNFHFMPELKSPYGYPILIGVVVIIEGLIWYWLYRKKYF